MFIFFLVGCKKDKKNAAPPSLSISTPNSGQIFHMYDTLIVSAHVSDSNPLTSISIVLTDTNHIPLQNPQNVSVQSNDFTFTQKYILSEFRLPTGTYILQITAADANNNSSAFQSITIIESPTIWMGYSAVLKSNQQNIVIYDSLKNFNWNIALTQNYNGMCFGGYNSELYVNGNNSMMCTAYNTVYKTPVYSVQANTNQINYTMLATDGLSPYVGFYNGNIYAYTNTGTQGTSYRYSGTYPSYPYYFTTTNNRDVAVFKSNAIGYDALVTFYSSGAYYSALRLFTNTPIKKVLAVFQKSYDSLYVVGNDSTGKGVVDMYTFSANAFSAGPIRVSEPILSATQINKQCLFFSTPTKIQYCQAFSAPMTAQAGGAQKIKFHPKLNVLSCAAANNISAYTYTTSAGFPSLQAYAKMSLLLADSVSDFEIITNK
ncbi:MAG: hypothetical protein JST67_05550 [Bacteroidetes bacterium]|nr:hypothetical protein [Bacteroidota bacterium]